jgi:hypothetical protein
MANVSVTYTFTNGTSADAGQVNTNFTDIINGTSDGTKDFSISALTVAGTLTANGAVTLGNATTDDITVTGSLASSIPVKTADTYDIGTAALPLQKVYLGDNGNSVGLGADAAASADWSFLFPPAAGTKGYGVQTSGSGAHVYAPMQTDINVLGDAAYTVLDDDGYRHILVGSSANMTAGRTITLPTASANTDRLITIKKMDATAFDVTVDGEGSETIDGSTTVLLTDQYDAITIVCDGSNWMVVGNRETASGMIEMHTGAGVGSDSGNLIRTFTTKRTDQGTSITYASDSAAGDTFTVNEDGIYAISYSDRSSVDSLFGISVNSSQVTVAISSITVANRLCITSASSGSFWNIATTVRLDSGDVIRAHWSSTNTLDSNANTSFTITQVAKT